jgi:hypothetical protein
MKYKVSGSNRLTGARMTMELDANNRATAERKAFQAGMEVLHVEQVTEGDEAEHGHRTGAHRGEFPRESRLGRRILLFVILAGAAVALFMYWDRIRDAVGR